MGEALRVKTELSVVVDLADYYAEQMAQSLPSVLHDERELRTCFAGTLLAFLADALSVAASRE